MGQEGQIIAFTLWDGRYSEGEEDGSEGLRGEGIKNWLGAKIFEIQDIRSYETALVFCNWNGAI